MLGAGTLLALFWLVRYLADVLVPFAVAVLLAYLINPMVTALEGRLRNRTAATLITVSGCLVILAALVVIAIPIVAGEMADFGQVLRNLQADSPGPWTLRERYDALVERQSSQTVQRILAAVREAVAKAGDDVLHDKDVKDTMKKVVKKAVKDAVKEAVQDAQDAQDGKEARSRP